MQVRSTSPRTRRFAGAVVALLVLVACESEGPRAVPEPTPLEATRGGAITFGVLGEPSTLDPYSPESSDLTYALVRPVYRSLYRMLPNGVAESDLAASETAVPGGLEVTLERAWWSDGTMVTARDIVASVKRAVPPSGFSGLQAKAVDRDTVRLKGEVSGDWVRHLGIGTFVLPGGKAGRLASGPFQIARFVPGLQVVYEPNRSAKTDRPLLDRITVQFISTLGTMLELLERKELDAAAMPSAVNIKERVDLIGHVSSSTPGWETISLDLGEVPDEALRRRIVAAIDRKAIEDGLVRDEGRIATRREVEPGGTGPAVITLAVPAGDELLYLMQRVIQRHLARVDITAQLVTIDPATFYGQWQLDSPVDVLLEREIVPFGERRVPKDLAEFPLFAVDTVVGLNSGVHGPEAVSPTIEGPLWNAETWWRE